MKGLSKIIFSVAAASTVAAAMAVSASAMTASYADGTVTLADVTATGASQTLLVLDGVDLQTIAETNIKQIDQKDDGESFASVPVGTLPNGTYEVRIGGSDGTMQTATFTVGGGSVETETILIGDVNLADGIDILDVGNLLKYANGATKRVGHAGEERTRADNNETILIGDVNLADGIDILDVGNLLKYVNGATKRVGHAGEEVEVVK